ncbi:MAG: metal-dependent hydrolase [bacterium]|nr:metal-dependent hydrolase [bacterium]
MKITYLGHSAFEIKIDNKKILIDPFLICSPDYNISGVTDVFVTHGHSDHLGNAIEISKRTGARITAIFELANYCSSQNATVNAIGLGAWLDYEWGKAIAVPAYHTSSLPNGDYAGCPCGYVFKIEGKTIYHAGDTCLNQEMKTIGEIYSPDIAMLPIGGQYTMDVEHAITASEWLDVTCVVPMHYNTFDAIKTELDEFERSIRNLGKMPYIMNAGDFNEI